MMASASIRARLCFLRMTNWDAKAAVSKIIEEFGYEALDADALKERRILTLCDGLHKLGTDTWTCSGWGFLCATVLGLIYCLAAFADFAVLLVVPRSRDQSRK